MNGDENCKDGDIWAARKCKLEEEGISGKWKTFLFLEFTH